MRSEKLFNESSKFFPGGVNSPVRFYKPYPVFISGGKGSRIMDVDGTSYIDFCLAYGPLILGHSHHAVRRAIMEQLEKGWLFGAPTELEVKLGEILSRLTGMDMMRFTNSGTEATMHAIRLGRAYTGKKKIVKMRSGYHGAHDYVLVSPGSGAAGIPSSPGIPDETSKNTLIAEFNDFDSVDKIFKENKGEIALLITEPVLGNIGVIEPLDGYIKFLREITEKYDSLLIMDEVITGFRIKYGTASQFYNVRPDLIVMGKIIGGGLPFALFGGEREIMEKISPSGNVYQAGTFSGNPLSVSAGTATIMELEKMNYDIFKDYLHILNKYVDDARDDFNEKITLNGIGGMFQIFFNNEVKNVDEALKSDSERYFSLFNYLLEKGFYLPPSQFESLFFSFVHERDEIESLGRTVYEFIGTHKDRK
ncbi:MAG: glutamate-1-semialdehyde 2,1-aminomutase [Thermoplasmatales archaeon]|nr:glutamate-1-semialdehyde 2,1-aminomutase [Thermoplasmatales archaeon]